MKPGETEANCVRDRTYLFRQVRSEAIHLRCFQRVGTRQRPYLIRQDADRLLEPEKQAVNLSEKLYGPETR